MKTIFNEFFGWMQNILRQCNVKVQNDCDVIK